MLQLLEPIWLAAMSGIVVPVLVHLWNDRRGKVLRIGSVALLAGASTRMAWRRRISDWWLLILRCLLLMALALLLAGPYWQRRPGGKGWVLTAAFDASTDGAYRGMIDSLVGVGYERHVLRDSLDYWKGFRIADREAPTGLSFYVITPGLVSRFSGIRPVTTRDVHWYTYAIGDSVARWEQRRWIFGKDSMVVLNGSSRATGTSWERKKAALAGPVDTTVFRYRAYGTDAKFIVAAMKALAKVTERPIAEGNGVVPGAHIDSALVSNGRLPVYLSDLLPIDTPLHDVRMIDPRQVEPEHRDFRRGEKIALEDVDLGPWVLGLVLLLFVLERIIAFNAKA